MKKIFFEHDLSTTSYGKIKELKYDIVILPWGATEPHNYHLPYLTDSILSQSVAIEASVKAFQQSQVRAMVLPAITLGSQNQGQWHLPFCIHTRYETQKAILTDIVVSLELQGISKLVIINGHGGNNFKNMIRDLKYDKPHFLIVTTEWFSIIPWQKYFEYKDDHAGELETSVMMYYHPELVDLSKAGEGKSTSFNISSLKEGVAWTPRDWSKVSEDTGIGNPKKATAEKGKKYADSVSSAVSKLLVQLVQVNLYS